jgi:hypothetical protein
MSRLMIWLSFVLLSSIAGAVVGGQIGRMVGERSPVFVERIAEPRTSDVGPRFNPPEFGFGLGVVCGSLMGCGTGLALVFSSCAREILLERLRNRRLISHGISGRAVVAGKWLD